MHIRRCVGEHGLAGGWILLLNVLVCGCGSQPIQQSTSHFPAGTGFVRRQLTLEGRSQDLWLFIPLEYQASQRWPAIVFLHGLFEAGDDGTRALEAGLAPVIAKSPDNWPFIVVFPQSDGTWKGPDRERLVMQSLELATREWNIDRDRVILAGLSYGGLGAWQIGARHPESFAAVVSVSGPRDLTSASALVHTPVWAFHSRGDPFVTYHASQRMCEEVSRLGGAPRLTLFPVMDHDCWDRAVTQTNLIDWMLQQRVTPHVTASAE